MGGSGRRLWARPELGRWLLLPHALACLAFAGGIAVVAIADTNRLAVDHALGIGGVVAGIAAVPASILACLQALLAPGLSRRWATPLMHIVSLLITLVMAGVWIALHLA